MLTKFELGLCILFGGAVGLWTYIIVEELQKPPADVAVNITSAEFSCTRYPDGKIVINQ